jgi:hypothetical protein
VRLRVAARVGEEEPEVRHRGEERRLRDACGVLDGNGGEEALRMRCGLLLEMGCLQVPLFMGQDMGFIVSGPRLQVSLFMG